MALLAAFVLQGGGETLEAFLAEHVFADAVRTTLQPDPADVEGFRTFLDQYKACLAWSRLPQKICKECTKMKNYEFWFVVGSQTLYGEEVLRTVAARAEEMAQKLSAVLPYPLKYKVTAKSNAEILDVVKEANYNDACAGIVTWCHTFSPSKMWINGLELLQKPWCHSRHAV